ncbi:MAG TPA: ABC transporter ATP-binding protein [Gaiellaceae bacterium]|nr:ABC transporter ATP-binding protein [Gaiellaceae bacterium]
MTPEEQAAPPEESGAPAPDVRLVQVRKHFRDTAAVDGIDLEIAQGEFFSLLGPSGCGKSTTLALIGGFEEPTGGEVWLGGREMSRVPPYRRDVNTVFQSYALFPHLDVASNVAFGLRRRKLPRARISSRVSDALELVGLAGLGKRKPAQLSGGQQQRVALARALVNEPRVLLLDEPLGALDLKLRKQMQLELKRIQREVGVTFLYVTHDQEEALAMSDRLAVMNLGNIEQIGAPEEVYERPATEFVADFLGASNLLGGAVTAVEGGVARIALDGAGEVRAHPDRLPQGAQRVKVGVRPEKLRPLRRDEAEPTGANVVQGRVRTSTYLGLGHQLEIDGPAATRLVVYVQNAGDEAPGAGADVRLCWRPEHTFVVRPAGGVREEEQE